MPATGWRHVKADSAMLARNPSAARAAARMSAAPMTAVARPGHAGTASSEPGGVIGTRVAMRPSAKATSATPHATSTARRVAGRSTAARAARTSPTMTQAGGVPGPPGSTRSSHGEGTDPTPVTIPRSAKSSPGCARRRSDHGRSRSSGTTSRAVERRTTSRPMRPEIPAVMSAAITARSSHTHMTGAHATTSAARREAPQGVRPDTGASPGARPRSRATTRASGGSRTMAIIAPSRPLAMAPVMAGRRAYAIAAHVRGPRAETMPRRDHHALSPAAGMARKRTSPTMSPALPSTSVASAASKAVSGAAGTVEPGPTSCQVSV